MFSLQNAKKYLSVAGVAAVSSLTLAAAPALAQSYDDGYTSQDEIPSVTVYAPRHAPRSGATGAPYEVAQATRVVDTHDLDLSTGWGMHALHVRVTRAARDACEDINRRFDGRIDQNNAEDNTRCIDRAVDRAMGEVQSTVYYGQ